MNGMQKFGQLIATARIARGLKGIDLAPRVGLGPSTLSDYENGTRKNLPDPAVLDALQRELGVSKRAMLEAWGYLDAAAAGEVLTIRADDPRAEIVRLLADVPDDRISVVVATITAQMPLLVGPAARPIRASQAG